jgi:hypothetical protein
MPELSAKAQAAKLRVNDEQTHEAEAWIVPKNAAACDHCAAEAKRDKCVWIIRPSAGEIEGSGVPALRPSHREELLGFRVLHRTYADFRQGRRRFCHYCLTSNECGPIEVSAGNALAVWCE